MKSLTRIRVGTVELDDLTPGEYRNLTREEISGLLSGKGSSQAKRKKTRTKRKNDAKSSRNQRVSAVFATCARRGGGGKQECDSKENPANN